MDYFYQLFGGAQQCQCLTKNGKGPQCSRNATVGDFCFQHQDCKYSASPVKAKSSVKVKSPVKAQSPVKAKSPVKVQSPVKAKSPIKAKSPVKAMSPAETYRLWVKEFYDKGIDIHEYVSKSLMITVPSNVDIKNLIIPDYIIDSLATKGIKTIIFRTKHKLTLPENIGNLSTLEVLVIDAKESNLPYIPNLRDITILAKIPPFDFGLLDNLEYLTITDDNTASLLLLCNKYSENIEPWERLTLEIVVRNHATFFENLPDCLISLIKEGKIYIMDWFFSNKIRRQFFESNHTVASEKQLFESINTQLHELRPRLKYPDLKKSKGLYDYIEFAEKLTGIEPPDEYPVSIYNDLVPFSDFLPSYLEIVDKYKLTSENPTNDKIYLEIAKNMIGKGVITDYDAWRFLKPLGLHEQYRSGGF